ncbi:MAG: hypothetical protein ACE5KT_09910 [Methanosarcinales archaeon]
MHLGDTYPTLSLKIQEIQEYRILGKMPNLETGKSPRIQNIWKLGKIPNLEICIISKNA